MDSPTPRPVSLFKNNDHLGKLIDSLSDLDVYVNPDAFAFGTHTEVMALLAQELTKDNNNSETTILRRQLNSKAIVKLIRYIKRFEPGFDPHAHGISTSYFTPVKQKNSGQY